MSLWGPHNEKKLKAESRKEANSSKLKAQGSKGKGRSRLKAQS
jgi:hypothetical protein